MWPDPRRRDVRFLRGPQAVLALLVLAVAYWGSVAWLVGLRSEVAADPDSLMPDDELIDEVTPEPFFEPRASYPRVLGLAYGTPPVLLTDRVADHTLCDTHPRLPDSLHLIHPQRAQP
jgi:hypothetical protein